MKINKRIFFIILLFIILMIPTIVNATEQTTTVGGVSYSYKLNENNQIEDLKCLNATNIFGFYTIPAKINGYEVISLGEYAFSSANNIISVNIPSCVKKIGYSAFKGCKDLSDVNLEAVESIGMHAFKDCEKLKSIKIPKTLVNSEVYAGPFTGRTKLTSITFEQGLTIIPKCFLEKCTNITNVTIPNSVKIIEEWAFSGSGITSITLPNSVKEIKDRAFYECEKLSNVNLGAVETIGEHVFRDCKNLKSIKIPKTLVNVPEYESPFTGTTKITSITFEQGLNKIPKNILMDCTSITNVTIPSSVKTIDDYAFLGSGLTNITIPSSVTTIKDEVFVNCENLTKAVVPSSVKNIGVDIFEGASKDLVLYLIKGSVAEKYAIAEEYKYIATGISISKCKISEIETKVYNGKELKQDLLIEYGNTKLKNGIDYKISYSNNVNPGKATMKITGMGTYTGTVTKTFNIRPKKVTGLKTKTYGTDYVTISWKGTTGATSYTVYVYNESAKTYKSLGTTKGTSVRIKGLKANKTYKFRIKAYKTIDGAKYQGAYSSTLTTGTKPATVKMSSVKSKSSKKATVKWKKVTGASGYEVYMATSKKGKYSKVKTVTKGSTVSYTKSSLKKKKTYYFKVRAYKTINGKKVYSSYSSIKSVKVK